MTNTLPELTEIIKIARHPRAADAFVSSEKIAQAVIDNGYFKWADQFLVNKAMIDAALLGFYPGIHSIGELQLEEGGEHAGARQRMANAIYAAFNTYKESMK